MMPHWVAHRGDNAHYPENTQSAMRAALAAGAHYIEFDVQMCADETLIVMHDDNLLRTCGVSQSVFDMTASDVTRFSAHEAQRFGDAFYPEPVPTLAQMLNLVVVHPDITAFVEIKEESLQHWGVERVMQIFLAQLVTHARQCVVISFSAAAIDFVQQHSVLRTGWVLHAYDEAHRVRAEQLAPTMLICNQRKLAQSQPWPGTWQWMLYGIETLPQAKTWGERGVAFVETDHITDMLRAAKTTQDNTTGKHRPE